MSTKFNREELHNKINEERTYLKAPPNVLAFRSSKMAGYFWCLETNSLYTIKVNGLLRQLPLRKPSRWDHAPGPFYALSCHGRRFTRTHKQLKEEAIADALADKKRRLKFSGEQRIVCPYTRDMFDDN
jgi:hypothetical protein